MIHDIVMFLYENGAHENEHSDRSLIDHLMGTASILKEWGCSNDVVLAGLCHSIYGTDSYHTVTIDHSRRDEVRKLIGEKAERLAWEFGRRKNFRLKSFVENEETDLVVIECANLIEQEVDPHYLVAALVADIPKAVRQTINKYLGTY